MNEETLSEHQRILPVDSPRRRQLFRIVAVGVGVLVAACVGELAARMVGLKPLKIGPGWEGMHRTLFQENLPGSALPYSLKPDARTEFAYRGPPARYVINADGLRSNRRYPRPKPEGVRRIVMLGDSVLFGLGVSIEQTFASRLEKILPSAEVINGGVGGYNTYCERRWLEAVGLSYQPDAIVLCYCPNDSDDPLDHFSAHTRSRLGDMDPAFIPNAAYHAMRRDKQDHAAKNSSNVRSWLARAATSLMQTSAICHAILRPLASGGASRTYERCLLATGDVASPELEWLRREFKGICGLARGVPVFFLYLPMQYEKGTTNPTYRAAQQNVVAAAREASMMVIDVNAALNAASGPYLDVTHLSPAGHAAVAAVLAEAMATHFK